MLERLCRYVLLSVLLAHTFLFPCQADLSQWSERNPNSDEFLSVMFDGAEARRMLAATTQGPYVSFSFGESWEELQNSPCYSGEWRWVTSDPKDPRTVYATTAAPRICCSQDGGRTWRAQTTYQAHINRVVVDTSDSNVIYGMGPYGLFVSRNKALSWESTTLPIDVAAVAPAPNQAGLVYVVANFRSFKSIDYGAQWQEVSPPGQQNALAIAVDPRNADVVYLGLKGGEVLKSTNGGATWQSKRLLPDAYFTALAVDPFDSAFIYATATNGVYRSQDFGNNWVEISEYGASSLVLDMRQPGKLAVAMYSVIGISEDRGSKWSFSKLGSSPPYYFRLAPNDPETLYATQTGLQKSTDGGVTWHSLAIPGFAYTPVVDALAVDFRNPDRVYAIATALKFDGTWKRATELLASENGGRSWQSRFRLGDGEYVQHALLEVDPRNPDTVYAGIQDGLFRSEDRGVTWARILEGSPVEIAFDPFRPRTIYGTGAASRDAGRTWESSIIGANNVLPDQRTRGVVFAGTSRKGIFKSTDSGRSWSGSSNGLADLNIWDLVQDPVDPARIYASVDMVYWFPAICCSGSLHMSEDSGENWSEIFRPTRDAIFDLQLSEDGSFAYALLSESLSVAELRPYGPADLKVDLWADGNLAAERDGTLKLHVTNVGKETTSGAVELVQALPAGVTLLSASGLGWTCSSQGSRVLCSRTEPLPGKTISEVTLNVRISSGIPPDALWSATVSASGEQKLTNNTISRHLPVDRVIYFPHVAEGVAGDLEIQSDFHFTNTAEDCELRIEFFDSQGRQAGFQLDGYGPPTPQVSTPLQHGQSIRLRAVSEQLRQGWAQVSGGSGLQGTLVLRYLRDGRILSETGIVPAAPLSSFDLIFESRVGAKATAVALANFGSGIATPRLELRNQAGEVVAETEINMLGPAFAPGSQTARYLPEIFPEIEEQGIELGSVHVSSDQPLGALALLHASDLANLIVLPPLPRGEDLPGELQTRLSRFPHLAAGSSGGVTVKTKLLMLNPGNDTSMDLSFKGNDGKPLGLKLEDGETTGLKIDMNAGETVPVETSADGPLSTGYAMIAAPRGVKGVAVFSMMENDSGSWNETAVPMTEELWDFSLFVPADEALWTGLALVNAGTEPASVHFRLYNRDFVTFAASGEGVAPSRTLAPGERLAVFVHELFGELKDFQGGLLAVQSSQPLSCVTLQQRTLVEGSALRHIFTTYPVLYERPD